jgi:hypothetical protein
MRDKIGICLRCWLPHLLKDWERFEDGIPCPLCMGEDDEVKKEDNERYGYGAEI